ncbi:unnamed protein product [Phyllotreta striolata]|uniref:PDZ domain-containing protein n=1 Tax=Phyllotreta striolata TaxID=444603 RepID=A0A9P0GWD3_PHYSR|nr:unnamed protein product [Phyllotreta striolata]
MVLNTEWAQVEVIDLINDGTGLAFGIIGGRSTGVVVKTILPGGVADRDGRLQSGDHILQIGEVNLRGLGSEQVASVLRQCGVHVRMVVARPIESANADFQHLGSLAPIVPTKILGDPVELDRHLIENGYGEAFAYHPAPSDFHGGPYIYTGHHHSDLQLHTMVNRLAVPYLTRVEVQNNFPKTVSMNVALREPDLPETEIYEVDLKKDDLGLGITVAGYVCEKEEISGIFVKSISKGSAADLTQNIQINDRIIEVNGVSLSGYTNHQAVECLRAAGSAVKLKLERYLRGPKYEQLQQAIKANELRPPSPPSPTLTSLPKVPINTAQMDCSGIEPDGESRTSFEFDSALLLEHDALTNEEKEILIGGEKVALQFTVDSPDSVYEKWRSLLGDDPEIIIARMRKERSSGLGISLEGTVDVEGGKEVRPHHYIRNVLPDGPVGQNGVLQSGDELLEANGVQLLGLNHLQVVAILKQLPERVSLVCARYPFPTGVIDTSQRREAFRTRKILACSLQTLIPINESNRLVKAKSETSITSGAASPTPSRSRSLDPMETLPMWRDEPTVVELIKGDHGLGFSVLDYQDPLDPDETVIVVRSLVPGGVAQRDGRLLPGDRLVSVNEANVERAPLDAAVRALKGAPRGVVRIAVVKPASGGGGDAGSRTSQDTEDDHTCLEDFQECIEEFQECLDAVHICIEDENSLSQSCMSDLGGSDGAATPKIDPDPAPKPADRARIKSDSAATHSEKDDYETCVEESLSDDVTAVKATPDDAPSDRNGEATPTNSTVNVLETCSHVPDLIHKTYFNSENLVIPEELVTEPIYHDEEPKIFENRSVDPGDEFLLVQYPSNRPDDILDTCQIPSKKIYRKCLKEYYNDYADCLEAYNVATPRDKAEMPDDDIFCDLVLPFKSRSAPDIADGSFVTLTYDPGPDMARRKSSFLPGCQPPEAEMTVIRPLEVDVKGCQVEDMLQKHWGSVHTARIFREPNRSLGINIVGGKVDLQSSKRSSETLLGIFVKNVVPNSPADKSGKFKTGDRILEVSGVDLRESSHEKAVQAIRNASNPVTFVIQSIVPRLQKTSDQQLNHAECPSPYPSPVSTESSTSVPQNDAENSISREKIDADVRTTPVRRPDEPPKETRSDKEDEDAAKARKIESDSDEEDDDDDDDVRDLEGRTVSAKGHAIDRASAGNVRRTKDEIAADKEDEDEFGYTTNKVRKKYANLGHSVLMVQLERSNQGLGLSLAGHKDRNCMAVFVCGLNPKGMAHKTGTIQIGDEILEVNGVVLHGRCHLNASAIIKGLSGPIFKVVILRRKTAIDDIAVKPITQFPVSLAEEASEEQFSASYPNVRTVAIKKQSNQSLGIMIIEGKHAEVGQGIFISDIQEGSSAEKAGLEIGELILAVNKDSLVGSNYETAANLLKRTEGLVTLVVSNPGKKDSASSSTPNTTISSNNAIVETNKNALSKPSNLKPSAPSSRPTTPVPEPIADPLTCQINPGRETTVEVTTENKGLGLFFVGGKDTQIPNGVIIVEVYPGGMAEKDGRLQPGDNVLEVNGTSLKDVSHTAASQALRQTLPKMKMIVYRPSAIEYTPIEADLIKKPGKGLGISFVARKSGKGIYVADIISGGIAELDGRIAKGDLLVSVNGQSLENSGGDEAGAILKTVSGKVSLKLNRYKPSTR